MSEITKTKPSGQSAIHPHLQAALNSLDLNLEAEISRYQSQKGQYPLKFSPNQTIIETPETEEKSLETVVILSQLNQGISPDETEFTQQPSKLMTLLESWFTPLGIACLLLLIVSSGIVGIIIVKTLVTPESVTTAKNSTEKPDINNESSQDLDLKTITNIPASDVGSGENNSQATSIPIEVTETQSDLTKVLLPPSIRGTETNNPINPSLSPDSFSATEASLPVSKVSSKYYYVIMEYDSRRSLKKAQSVIKDAYALRLPQGMTIMMGAYDLKEDAQRFVKELKGKGLSTSVYHPQ